MKQFVIYIRVSTRKQGASGLGLEAQRKMCADFINTKGGTMAQEFLDVESGTHRDRKGLWNAIEYCKANNCPLVIAKLDRLARDVEFCFHVINTGIEIYFVDMPQINSLLLGVFASVAQYERELTSERTTKALAAKKARGEKTGGGTTKWRTAYDSKSNEQKHNEGMKKGITKNKRHMESKDVQVFLKVLRNVFPDACKGEPNEWDWSCVNTKDGNRQRILGLMADYKDFDPTIFAKWDLSDVESTKMQVKLASYINALRKSVEKYTNV